MPVLRIRFVVFNFILCNITVYYLLFSVYDVVCFVTCLRYTLPRVIQYMSKINSGMLIILFFMKHYFIMH